MKLPLPNILVNALEAMNETDNPQLHITFSQRILRIEDNGVGISEEQQNHLFEPYFTTQKTGVGLGLASTLSILKVHGISIDVQSEIGEGTAFTLILPI